MRRAYAPSRASERVPQVERGAARCRRAEVRLPRCHGFRERRLGLSADGHDSRWILPHGVAGERGRPL